MSDSGTCVSENTTNSIVKTDAWALGASRRWIQLIFILNVTIMMKGKHKMTKAFKSVQNQAAESKFWSSFTLSVNGIWPKFAREPMTSIDAKIIPWDAIGKQLDTDIVWNVETNPTRSVKNITLQSVNFAFELFWPVNPYPWILEKKSKTRDHHRAWFAEKKSRAQHWINLYMFLCCGFFFQKTLSVTVPKNGIYFWSLRHISAHIGICHLKLISYYSPTGTVSAHIIFIA